MFPPQRAGKPRGSPPGRKAPPARAVAQLLILILVLVAVGCGAAGIALQFGLGWMLLFVAAACGLLAVRLAKGVNADG